MRKIILVLLILLSIQSYAKKSRIILQYKGDNSLESKILKLAIINELSNFYTVITNDTISGFVVKIQVLKVEEIDLIIYNYIVLYRFKSGTESYLSSVLGYAGLQRINEIPTYIVEQILSDQIKFAIELLEKK